MMDITLTLREKPGSDYEVQVHVAYGRAHLRGVQSSGTFISANITSESWPSVKAFIDQQLADQPQPTTGATP